MGQETPLGIALIICDRVIVDARSSEKTLVATFSKITSPRFPVIHPRISIFVSVTNGRGPTNGRIRCMNESTAKQLFSAEGPIHFKDPLHVVEITFRVRNVIFPSP